MNGDKFLLKERRRQRWWLESLATQEHRKLISARPGRCSYLASEGTHGADRVCIVYRYTLAQA